MPLPLILNAGPVRRSYLLSADRPTSGVAVVYATGGEEIAYFSGRLLGWTELILSHYRTRYEVDISDHRRTVELRSTPLPSRGDQHFFVATVDVAFRVHDPVEIVRRSVQDALPVVYGFLANRLEMITRNFDIGKPAEAEEAIRQAFASPSPLPEGITVFEVSTRLRPDDLANEYLKTRRDARRTSDADAALHHAELERLVQAHRINPLEEERHAIGERELTAADMAREHLIRHPEDTEKVIGKLLEHERAMQQAQDVHNQRTTEFVKFMMETAVMRSSDIEPLLQSGLGQLGDSGSAILAATGSASASSAQPAAREEDAVPAPSQPSPTSVARDAGTVHKPSLVSRAARVDRRKPPIGGRLSRWMEAFPHSWRATPRPSDLEEGFDFGREFERIEDQFEQVLIMLGPPPVTREEDTDG